MPSIHSFRPASRIGSVIIEGILVLIIAGGVVIVVVLIDLVLSELIYDPLVGSVYFRETVVDDTFLPVVLIKLAGLNLFSFYNTSTLS